MPQWALFLYSVLHSCTVFKDMKPIQHKESLHMYSNIAHELIYNISTWAKMPVGVVTIENNKRFKPLAKNPIQYFSNINLFAMNFFMYNLIAKQLSRSGPHHFLDASPFEHFNYVIKTVIRTTSIRRDSTLVAAALVMNISAESVGSRTNTKTEMLKAELGRNGTVTNFAQIMIPTIPTLAHLEIAERCVLVLLCLKTAQESFRSTGCKFPSFD